jgi:uncharacterized coiled-coil protein SlyX
LGIIVTLSEEDRIKNLETRVTSIEDGLIKTQAIVGEAALEIAKNSSTASQYMQRVLDLIEGLSIEVADLSKWHEGLDNKSRKKSDRAELTKIMGTMHKHMVDAYSLSELKELEFEMGLKADSITGESVSSRSMNLLGYCLRRRRLGSLAGHLIEQRPNYPWPKLEDGVGYNE